MYKAIQGYLESCWAFNRMFGEEGFLQIGPSAIHPRLLDVEIIGATGDCRPFTADDLKEIGSVLINLADKLQEKE